MSQQKLFIVFLLTIVSASCNNRSKYPYAIKDFRHDLQPHLSKMVEVGIVMYRNNGLQDLASDAELEQLGRSEHPILRAAAFREMLDRKSINHFDVVMAHLDDTAVVFTDNGEFGIWDRTVSDDVLQTVEWKTQDDMSKTVDQVLAKHNYLRSAYTIVRRYKLEEKHYPFIKDMATRPRRLDALEGYELAFGDIEYALYGLASFKKNEDVKVIEQRLMNHVSELSDVSFQLLKEFPNGAYFDILQTYHRRQFYQFSGNRPHRFSGVATDKAAPEDFIEALAAQKTEKSARLMDTMFTILRTHTCLPDKESIYYSLEYAIWDNPCPAYTRLRERIRPKMEALLKENAAILPIDRSQFPLDTTHPTYRWYR